ncbi:MAG: ribose 5-phosphate isomerase B [Candidatus Omnitrophica bacterium]|nr:ribose 5-phosphate isomerase B [Candidatus Omnitrophota bacterium]
MKIAFGADHGGFTLKSEIKEFVSSKGYGAVDFGTNSAEPCDYPLYAYKVAKAVSDGRADRGILICKSGNGMAIVANKLPNVRAAICFDKDVAALSRRHNNANILVLGSEHLLDDPEDIVSVWLGAPFEGGRHKRRVNQIAGIEKKMGPARKGKNKK